MIQLRCPNKRVIYIHLDAIEAIGAVESNAGLTDERLIYTKGGHIFRILDIPENLTKIMR